MEIVDLTDYYIKHVVKNNDLAAYEKSYPALFRHYFRYWGRRKSFRRTLSESEVVERASWMKNRLKKIESKFQLAGFDLSSLRVALFVGQCTSNGHACKDGNWVVWLPLETYDTPLKADVFITHEIAHALHYDRTPDFYFSNVTEKRSLSRQLITEGLATYLTIHILGCSKLKALWADYLPQKQTQFWFAECKRRELELYRVIVRRYHETNTTTQLFVAYDATDVFKFRAGYYAGLKLIEGLVREESLTHGELLELPRAKFEKLVYRQLQTLSE